MKLVTYSMKFPSQPAKGGVPAIVAIGGDGELKKGSLPSWNEMPDDYYLFFNLFPFLGYSYAAIGVKKGWLVKNYKKNDSYFNLLPANTGVYSGGTPIINYNGNKVYGRAKCIPNIGLPGFTAAAELYTAANGLKTETDKHNAPTPTDFASFIEYVKIKFQTNEEEDSYYKWLTTTYFNAYGSLLLEKPTKQAMIDFYNNTCIIINYHPLSSYWSGILSYVSILSGSGNAGAQTINNNYIFLLPNNATNLNVYMTANYYPHTSNLGYSAPPNGTYTFNTAYGEVEIPYIAGNAGEIIGEKIALFKTLYVNPSGYVRRNFSDIQNVTTPLDFKGDIEVQDPTNPNAPVNLRTLNKILNKENILRSLVYEK